MYTKTHITIGVSGGTIRVKKGAIFKVGDILVDEINEEIEILDVGKLLGASAKDIWRYLIVSDGEFVEKGQIIARKKGLLHKTSLKSPISATFKIIDKVKGTVGLKRTTAQKRVVAEYPGVVMDVKNDGILVEIKGTAISVKDGRGRQTTGDLMMFPETITMLSMPTDIAGKIIALKNAASDLMAKADTLGAKGVIMEQVESPEFMLPYVLVPDISAVSRYNDKRVFIHGDHKLLLILEGAKHEPR